MEQPLEKQIAKIKNVIMYSRISSENCGEESLQSQEDKMFLFAEANSLSVIGAYREVASGSLEPYSRPILQKVLQECRNQKKCVLLVSDVDRLTEYALLVYQLNDDRNIRFISAKHGLRADQLQLSMAAIFAQESKRLRCEANGETVVRVSEEGRLRYAQNKKPLIEGLIRYGLTIEEVVQNMINIQMETLEGEWTVEYVESILKTG